ncbi:hypothetical protein MMC16_000483 [Acarospora aff. strigata]|nr:hypothetical protein [Acarospora aff. strigata]
MSSAMAFAQDWFLSLRNGHDNPLIPNNAQRPRSCKVAVLTADGSKFAFGAFNPSTQDPDAFVYVSFDISSQMPLINIRIIEGSHEVVIAYDNARFDIWLSLRHQAVDDSLARMGEFGRTFRGQELRQLALVQLRPRGDGKPVLKKRHGDGLTGARRQLYDLLAAGSSVRLYRVIYPGVKEVFNFYHQIQVAREELVPTGMPASDYWYYTNERDYSMFEGERLSALDEPPFRTPRFPYWMATKVDAYNDRRGDIPIEWGYYPAKDTFHNMHEYEIVMGVATRAERQQATSILGKLFSERIAHTARFDRVSRNRQNIANIHIDLNTQDEKQKVIPPTGTSIDLAYVRDNLETDQKFSWRGKVVDMPTTSDFVILAEAKSKNRWSEITRKVALEAIDDSTSINRMIQGLQDAVKFRAEPLPEGDRCGRFDLQDTLLAHGLRFDPIHSPTVNLFDLFSAGKELNLARTKIQEVLNIYKLDPSQTIAFKASTERLVGGLSLIQGPPGTGKTIVNACIAVSMAYIGIPVLVTASSNVGTDQLLSYIVTCMKENPTIRAAFDVVRFNTPATISEMTAMQRPDDLLIDAMASMGLSNTGVSDHLARYTMASKIEDHVRRNLRTDTDCAEWFRLRTLILSSDGATSDKDYPDFIKLNKKLSKVILRLPQMMIVASTLNNTAHKILRQQTFKPVVLMIDEAGQSNELDNVIAMTMPSLRAVILTGDQKQLPPMVLSLMEKRNPYAQQLDRSLFARLINRNFPYSMLKTNYRMHPDIADFPNRLFYDGQFTNAAKTTASTNVSRTFVEFCQNSNLFRGLLDGRGDSRRLFLNVQGASKSHRGSTSLHNLANVNVVLELISALLSYQPADPDARRLKSSDIGVITPYKEEKQEIVRGLNFRAQRLDAVDWISAVHVATVNGFQGSEREIIILDLTTANTRRPENIGFVGDARRLNVALTRAKTGLIVIGNMTLWWPVLGRITPSFREFLRDVSSKAHQIDWPRNRTSDTLQYAPQHGAVTGDDATISGPSNPAPLPPGSEDWDEPQVGSKRKWDDAEMTDVGTEAQPGPARRQKTSAPADVAMLGMEEPQHPPSQPDPSDQLMLESTKGSWK